MCPKMHRIRQQALPNCSPPYLVGGDIATRQLITQHPEIPRLVPSSFVLDTLGSAMSSSRDTPLSQTLRFPTGPQNQCVIMNVLTVSIQTQNLIGRKEKVEVESKDCTKQIFLPKYSPFSRPCWDTSSSKAPSSGQAGSSPSSRQRDLAEGVEETVVKSYPAVGDQDLHE